MVAGTLKAFIDVDLAKLANGSMRTGTFERVNQIVTYTIVLATIGIAVVDVQIAIFALVPLGTYTLIGSDEIFTGGSILTWIVGALVNFVLAVAAIVAIGAHALVTVTNVPAIAFILAKLIDAVEASKHGGRLARHISDVADFARPTSQAITLVSCSPLRAACTIFAG